jgi:DnaK suppressor protein
LNQIDRALARLTQGTYGICELCQVKIPLARLNALPFSTTCINCQKQTESCSGGARRRGGEDWEKIAAAEPAREDQHEIDLTNVETDQSRNY